MRPDSKTRFGWKLRATLVATLGASGCSMMNPYDTVPDRPIAPVPAIEGMRLAGGASESLQTAEQMRQIYFNNLKYTAYVRSGTGIAAGVLTGWTLYNALQPNSESNDGDTRRRVRLAATLATLFGLRELFVNSAQESIYAQGYRSLTCLMLQSAPLLMTELAPRDPLGETMPQPVKSGFIDKSLLGTIRPTNFSAAVTDDEKKQMLAELKLLFDKPERLFDRPFHSLLPAHTDTQLGDLDRLQLALDRLETLILAVNVMTSREKAKADANVVGIRDMKNAQTALREQIDDSEKVLRYARNALSDGRTLVRVIQGAGQQIRNRVGVIVGSVNEDVQGKQKSAGKAADSIKDAHDITSTIINIGVSTATDQAAIASDGPVSWNRMYPDFVLLAGPASAIGDRLKTRNASTNFTEDELKALRDSVDGMLKRMAKREEEAAFKAREEAIASFAKALLNKYVPPDPTATRRLATGIEMLYAARRPVVQELANFRRKARDAAALPGCSDLAVLRVTPNEVARAHRGTSLSYLISQRAPGSPFAVLHGPHEPKKGVHFELNAVQGTTMYQAVIKVGDEMPKQTISLVVTDSNGIASQIISIVAGDGKRTEDKPDGGPASAP